MKIEIDTREVSFETLRSVLFACYEELENRIITDKNHLQSTENQDKSRNLNLAVLDLYKLRNSINKLFEIDEVKESVNHMLVIELPVKIKEVSNND